MLLTLEVKEDKLDSFIELIQELDYIQLKEEKIPEWHKEIVRERIKKSEQNPERLLNWDEVKDNFRFD